MTPDDANAGTPNVGTGRFEGVVVVVGVAALGEDGCWAVLQVVDANGEVLTAVGPTLGRFAEVRRRVALRGVFRTHPKYGPQIHAQRVTPALSLELERHSPQELLRLAPHVGAKRAQLLVDHYGEEAVINQIDRNPRHAFQKIAGMPHHHAGAATRWWLKQRRHGEPG